MTIENFIWDSHNQSVSWLYDGKVIKETFKNAHFASVNRQKNFVYVEAGKNYSQDQIYHLSFDGGPIFIFDKVNNIVRWLNQDKMVEVNCKKIVNAQLYIGQVVLIITASNGVDRRLQGFALDGTLLFEKEPPQGYKFEYLSTSKNKPSVVCDVGKTNVDAYGRNSWYFTIDTKTGDMTKENLAY
ncbi:hypothetical protein [Clostridium manihotivorum]|uniref:Uncharacterized protein n=1 Tax=Clostridium manihotivorum TaxID=2320868 RepID=A0A3R5R037_9CLOT|nr:hypothetical protein [Clostridium manihotivorum]QAA33527.1 hypothetical protein C1I91_18780 [Clostridium manihotivorum]